MTFESTSYSTVSRFSTSEGLRSVSPWPLAVAQIAAMAVLSTVVAFRSNDRFQSGFEEIVSDNAAIAAALLGVLTVLASVALSSLGLLSGIVIFVVLTGLFDRNRDARLATKVLLVASIPLVIRNLASAAVVGSGLAEIEQLTAIGRIDAAVVAQTMLLIWLTHRVLGTSWPASIVCSSITVLGGAIMAFAI